MTRNSAWKKDARQYMAGVPRHSVDRCLAQGSSPEDRRQGARDH